MDLIFIKILKAALIIGKNFRNSTYGPNIYQNFEAALIIGKNFRM
jgi:hypothetical protein